MNRRGILGLILIVVLTSCTSVLDRYAVDQPWGYTDSPYQVAILETPVVQDDRVIIGWGQQRVFIVPSRNVYVFQIENPQYHLQLELYEADLLAFTQILEAFVSKVGAGGAGADVGGAWTNILLPFRYQWVATPGPRVAIGSVAMLIVNTTDQYLMKVHIDHLEPYYQEEKRYENLNNVVYYYSLREAEGILGILEPAARNEFVLAAEYK